MKPQTPHFSSFFFIYFFFFFKEKSHVLRCSQPLPQSPYTFCALPVLLLSPEYLAAPAIVVLLLLIPLSDCTWPLAHSSLHCTSVSLWMLCCCVTFLVFQMPLGGEGGDCGFYLDRSRTLDSHLTSSKFMSYFTVSLPTSLLCAARQKLNNHLQYTCLWHRLLFC